MERIHRVRRVWAWVASHSVNLYLRPPPCAETGSCSWAGEALLQTDSTLFIYFSFPWFYSCMRHFTRESWVSPGQVCKLPRCSPSLKVWKIFKLMTICWLFGLNSVALTRYSSFFFLFVHWSDCKPCFNRTMLMLCLLSQWSFLAPWFCLHIKGSVCHF